MASASSAQPAGASASIFGAAASDVKKKPIVKRVMLKNIDSVAAQSLDPYNVSVIDDQPLETIAKVVKKGNTWAQFHAECYSEDEERQGIFWSRFAETNVDIIKELRARTELKACIKDNVWTRALEEAEQLFPHFEILNFGKTGSEKEDDSFGGLKRKRTKPDAKSPPSKEQIEAAAGELWAFLVKGAASNYRMLVNILSVGGILFAGQAMDLTARSYINHAQPLPSQAHLVAALVKRGAASTTGTSTTSKKRKEVPTGNLIAE